MRRFSAVLVTAALTGTTIAAPVDAANDAKVTHPKVGVTTTTSSSTTTTSTTAATADHKSHYEIHQVDCGRQQAAPIQLANAFAKYDRQAPTAVAKAAANVKTNNKLAVGVSPTGSVTANPEPYDNEYLCQITVGNQNIILDLDTGSSDLWVFSTELSAANQAGHQNYNPTKSTTAKKLAGQSWSIQYGDGSSASGDVYADNVVVGGLTVTSQAVEAAQTVSPDFQSDTDNNGIMGLAFSTGNTVTPTQQKTFFDMAIAQKKLAANLFTANLKKGLPGSYTFGSIDPTQYVGSITYTSVDSSQALWSFTSSGYQIGTSAFTSTPLTGIADTGTTLLLLPSNIVTAYYNKVAGAAYDPNYGAYTFPCTSILPNFVVGVSTARYTVPGFFMNFAPLGDGSNKCYGGLQSSDGMGINVFGDIFLKAVFVVFDKTLATPRIGFANKVLPTS